MHAELIYLALVATQAMLLTDRNRGRTLLHTAPVAFYLPLVPVFMLDAFLGMAITSTRLVLSALVCALFSGLRKRDHTIALGMPSSPPRALIALALATIAFWLVAPLFGYDAFLYHLPIAGELFRTGHLPTAVTSIFDLPRGYPPLCYLANGALWILGGAREHVSPRLLAIAFHLGFVMLVASEAGLPAAWLAATSPAYVEFLHPIGTDLPMACLGLIWAFRARAGDAPLAALALALALWTKYQALTFWAAGLAGLVLTGAARPLVLGHLLALAAFVPFLIRNALVFGNPVFPAGGAGVDPWVLANLAPHLRAGAGLDLVVSGLVWLGLCPALWLLLLSKPSEPGERFLRITCWIAVALWLALWVRPASMPGRFLLPVLGLASALAAPHWLELERSPRESRLLPRFVTALVVAQVAWLAAGTYQEPPHKSAYRAVAFVLRDGQPGLLAVALLLHRTCATPTTRRVLVGALAVPLVFQCLDKERWLAQKLLRHGWVADRSFDPDRIEYAYLARPGARVLAVGGLPDLLPGDALHVEALAQRDLLEAPTAPAALEALARRGVTLVFVDEVVAASLAVYQRSALRQALTQCERVLHEPDRMSVYRVVPSPPR